MDKLFPEIIRKVGNLINPMILKFKDEEGQLLVFYFHGLFTSEKEKELNHIDPQNNMTTHQFIKFIEYFLSHNYKFILPEEIPLTNKNNQPCAIITFDDGYYNNTLAIEIMEKYKIPGVIFLSTSHVTENKSYWWDIIYKYRKKSGNSLTEIRKEQISLKNLKYTDIDQYILNHFGKQALTPWSDIDRPFNEKEIRDFSTNPLVLFGNHTHNHAIVTNYSRDEIRKELETSNKIIHGLTGKVPDTMAFPNGNYNVMALEECKDIGLRYIVNTECGINTLPISTSDGFTCLKRFMTNPTEIKNFGGFCRLDYEPGKLYYHLKSKTKEMLRINKD